MREPRSASEYTATRADAELAEGAEDADGDLAPVGDQDLREHDAYSLGWMTLADQPDRRPRHLAPLVVLLFALHFDGHDYWATGLFCVAMSTDWFDGRIARRLGRTSSFGSLLDPVADKVLVLGDARRPARPARVPRLDGRSDRRPRAARQRPAARGARARRRDRRARPRQAEDLVAGGRRRRRRPRRGRRRGATRVSWWFLLLAVALTWLSGLDYARSAPTRPAWERPPGSVAPRRGPPPTTGRRAEWHRRATARSPRRPAGAEGGRARASPGDPIARRGSCRYEAGSWSSRFVASPPHACLRSSCPPPRSRPGRLIPGRSRRSSW